MIQAPGPRVNLEAEHLAATQEHLDINGGKFISVTFSHLYVA